MIRATTLAPDVDPPPIDTVTLDYDHRFRRRMAMTCDGGLQFLLDLAEATELREGDRLLLETGATVEVRAAPEALIEARASDPQHLARAAWHVGNRHLPCEVRSDRILLRDDHVIAQMLERLGCTVVRLSGPFTPEGGAYGAGRTSGHQHTHTTDASQTSHG